MTRFSAVFLATATALATLSLPLQAQQTPPPVGYASPGVATDASQVMALRAEVAAMRADVKDAEKLYADIKTMLTQVSARQQSIYVQVANLSQTQVDKDTLLKSAKAEIEGLNAQIQQARTDMGALERRMAELRAAPAPAAVAPEVVAAPMQVAVAETVPALEQQCAELRRGTAKTWQRVVPQVLPDHVFEEVDRAGDRVWARKGTSSQGFVYGDVMRKIGCEP